MIKPFIQTNEDKIDDNQVCTYVNKQLKNIELINSIGTNFTPYYMKKTITNFVVWISVKKIVFFYIFRFVIIQLLSVVDG